MKFILNSEDINDRNHILYNIKRQDIEYKIGLRNIHGYMELSITSSPENRRPIIDAFCKKFNITLEKDTSPWNNPYWNFYKIDCDWSQFQPDIDRSIKENEMEHLVIELAKIPTEHLKEVLKRRERK